MTLRLLPQPITPQTGEPVPSEATAPATEMSLATLRTLAEQVPEKDRKLRGALVHALAAAGSVVEGHCHPRIWDGPADCARLVLELAKGKRGADSRRIEQMLAAVFQVEKRVREMQPGFHAAQLTGLVPAVRAGAEECREVLQAAGYPLVQRWGGFTYWVTPSAITLIGGSRFMTAAKRHAAVVGTTAHPCDSLLMWLREAPEPRDTVLRMYRGSDWSGEAPVCLAEMGNGTVWCFAAPKVDLLRHAGAARFILADAPRSRVPVLVGLIPNAGTPPEVPAGLVMPISYPKGEPERRLQRWKDLGALPCWEAKP